MPRDFALWRVAMSLIAPARVLPYPVGRWIYTSHQISRWYYSPEKDQLLFREGQTTVVFVRKQCTRTRNSGQTFFYESRTLEYPYEFMPTMVRWDGTNPNEVTMEGYTTSSSSIQSFASMAYPI